MPLRGLAASIFGESERMFSVAGATSVTKNFLLRPSV